MSNNLRIICRSFSNCSSEMEGVWNLYLIYYFAGQIQTYLIDKNRYRKSINIIDIIWFNPPTNIDWYRKSQKNDYYRLTKLITIDVRTLFLHRFLSFDIGNWGSSMIDIDYYWLLSIISLSINYVWTSENPTLWPFV